MYFMSNLGCAMNELCEVLDFCFDVEIKYEKQND